MITPVNAGCPVGPSKLKSIRLTRAINDATGDMFEREDDWRGANPHCNPVSPPGRNEHLAGWAEFEKVDEGRPRWKRRQTTVTAKEKEEAWRAARRRANREVHIDKRQK